ncbi:winged helix-turn-helix transcriptional regulator [Kitasatospora sp. NPDC006697]|uniref:winged helix-turn-helix transcriptional regulator n=1 Tax=Kitasatospora sp. NPDC006697 TaxID=3364020 RepID=UPI00368AD0B3
MSPEPAAKPAARPCSIAAALQVLGERWALLAVRELFYGNHRFEQIVRNTGAPRDRLTNRLRALEEAGVLERRQYQDRPVRHEYHLTEAGRQLAPVVQALRVWGDRWMVEEPPVTLHHHGHRVDPSWSCRECGEELSRGGLTLEIHSPGWRHDGPVPD